MGHKYKRIYRAVVLCQPKLSSISDFVGRTPLNLTQSEALAKDEAKAGSLKGLLVRENVI